MEKTSCRICTKQLPGQCLTFISGREGETGYTIPKGFVLSGKYRSPGVRHRQHTGKQATSPAGTPEAAETGSSTLHCTLPLRVRQDVSARRMAPHVRLGSGRPCDQCEPLDPLVKIRFIRETGGTGSGDSPCVPVVRWFLSPPPRGESGLFSRPGGSQSQRESGSLFSRP